MQSTGVVASLHKSRPQAFLLARVVQVQSFQGKKWWRSSVWFKRSSIFFCVSFGKRNQSLSSYLIVFCKISYWRYTLLSFILFIPRACYLQALFIITSSSRSQEHVQVWASSSFWCSNSLPVLELLGNIHTNNTALLSISYSVGMCSPECMTLHGQLERLNRKLIANHNKISPDLPMDIQESFWVLQILMEI